MSGSSIPIPKFSSFRPKPTQPPVGLKERPKPRVVDREHVNHRTPQPQAGSELCEVTRPANNESLWVIDRKGDDQNLVYGSIHRYSIPPFHRSGGGGVLGAPSSMKIDRDMGDDKSIILVNRGDSKFVPREKNIFSKVEREKPRLLKIRPELLSESSTNDELDFISLAPKGRKQKRADNDSSGSDGETNYRSINGKSKLIGQPADDAFQFATESESSGSERSITLDSSLKQRTVQLSRKVEQSPHDIDAWLALIEHQDTLIPNDGRRQLTSAEIKSTADIKIHMYEKALEKSRSLQDRERLLLGLMSEGSKVWEIKTQAERWEQISKENMNSLILWSSYVNFRQATFSAFRQEEMRDVFVKRIRLLFGAINSASSEALSSLYTQLLYVILRFTIFTRESGYSELAIAIWQGVLEFNFFAPPSLTSQGEKVTSFKEFWESEAPRIGEDDASGWCQFVESADTSEPGPTLIDEVPDSLDKRDLFRSWAKAERSRSKASLNPARTMDEVIEDDPFRVILVSDIEEFLVSLPLQSDDLRKSLLNAFLLFCRQSPLIPSGKVTSGMPSDPFIRGELLDADPAWIDCAYFSMPRDLEDRDAELSYILNNPSPNFASAPESMFGSTWLKSLLAWRDIFPSGDGSVKYKWFRNTLRQLVQGCGQEDLAEYYLAFEYRNEPETIKKISKSVLKQHFSSLRLYNAYAMIEWSRGNKDVARSVFSAALSMSKSILEHESKESIILWKSWVWASLDDLDNNAALSRLLSITDCNLNKSVSFSPATLLRTRQHLLSSRDFFTSSGDLDYAIRYAECHVLLQYLSTTSAAGMKVGNQGDIVAAISAYSEFSQALADHNFGATTAHELFLQSAARLLYHHTRTGPFRPALIREQLTKFLILFPKNTLFLSLYAINEFRLRIDNRVRGLLLSNILAPQNDVLTSRMFAIQYEISHGTIYSVRAAFENALSSPSCKSSGGLWRLYILYCLRTPKFRPRVKEIWYRALRACPWSKELYILGFEKFEGLVAFDEFKETWRVMGEKELRIHIDLEEAFDEMRELESHESKKPS
jgi:hypothetical protein